MLVLSRKADQQIKIGDDITLTVVRVDGNRVRIGISAPRDVRILRGELAAKEADSTPLEFELDEREFAFAHQQATDRIAISKRQVLESAEPKVFCGTVSADGSKVELNETLPESASRAPLANFVSAS